MSGLYNPNFSPARAASPQIRSTPDVDSQYLSELLAEHQKLGPFMQVLPICSRLLNQEILRVSGMMSNQGFGDFDRLRHRSPSPMASSNLMSSVTGTGLGGWNGLPQERLSGPPGMTMDWQGAPASPSSYTVKRILRLEIPVDTYPNFNFVGRLLGPRGNSLKRVEATTGCRVYIRGKGSIKDPDKLKIGILKSSSVHFNLKEEKLRGRPGYEHLNEPLHILIEADLPASVVDMRLRQAQEIIEELLKPVDESQDYIKRQQLRELAMLNSNFREESPGPSGSVSPFNSSGMKRAKTGR
ncbi:hypothetical protein CJ030_MR2G024697 [Morella rubra]|uniref:K Homology domain-containing protein n=1 Tax=Morella rubra TaxID=262757 RepID=A0A6A1WLE4_9ROSI|nr:hypothetical protein CJ030_MR2G024697 [Morella rubra]